MTDERLRKRRTKEEIAQAKADKEARRVAREVEQKRRDEVAAAARAELAEVRYLAQIEHEKRRAGQRLIQEAGMDLIMGRDTPGARWAKKFLESNKKADEQAAQRAKKAGDPLNLTGHTKAPTGKQNRRKAEAERLARGDRFEAIPDPEHPKQNVVITTTRHALRRKTLIQQHHLAGVDLFLNDVEALRGTVRSPNLSDKVDSSSAPSTFPHDVLIAQRLEQCQAYIGEKNFKWAMAYLVLGVHPTSFHAMGGSQHTTGSNRIREALNELCAFYDKSYMSEDPDLVLLRRIVDEGIQLIMRGERDLNWAAPPPKRNRESA